VTSIVLWNCLALSRNTWLNTGSLKHIPSVNDRIWSICFMNKIFINMKIQKTITYFCRRRWVIVISNILMTLLYRWRYCYDQIQEQIALLTMNCYPTEDWFYIGTYYFWVPPILPSYRRMWCWYEYEGLVLKLRKMKLWGSWWRKILWKKKIGCRRRTWGRVITLMIMNMIMIWSRKFILKT
jgi:hypothetical protein